MSRHHVKDKASLERIILNKFTSDSTQNSRLLIVVESPSTDWFHAFTEGNGFSTTPGSSTADRADRITTLLGREYRRLAYSLDSPMDASLLAALAGTVTRGGILLLGTTPCDCHRHARARLVDSTTGDRTDAQDPLSHSAHCSHFENRFYRLLSECEQQAPEYVHLIHYGEAPTTRVAGIHTPEHPSKFVPQTLLTTDPWSEKFDSTAPSAQDEQDRLLANACAYISSNTTGSITVIGGRGRGKTTLLARLANWLDAQEISYQLTAGHPSALKSFDKSGPSALANYQIPENILTSSAHQVLLIDEAGNLPVSTLKRLLHSHSLVVFCTTVEGYESAGRAFDLRFASEISTLHPNAITLNPKASWRWHDGDTIELLCDKLVLKPSVTSVTNSNSSQDPEYHAGLVASGITMRRISQAELASDEKQLSETFGLLRRTHYQTTVQDLQNLLDAPDLQIWIAEAAFGKLVQIAGVLVVSIEKGIPPHLHEAVVKKERRLPHQLLPQLLAQMANCSTALECNYARVVRISVSESLRRQGLGSRLLRFVESALPTTSDKQQLQIKAIGASFASDTSSLAFWRSNGYTEFHRGFRHNPRTGKAAVAMIKALDTQVLDVVEKAAAIHSDNQSWRQQYKHDSFTIEAPEINPSSNDSELLARFACGQRNAHDTHAALSRLAQQRLISLDSIPGRSRRAHESALRQAVARVLSKGSQA